uniref:Uncharacterized protein n=1 Tax=Anguilla anguilla TaxID=7936 RepID=A0A0E9W1Z8_ANGAN
MNAFISCNMYCMANNSRITETQGSMKTEENIWLFFNRTVPFILHTQAHPFQAG